MHVPVLHKTALTFALAASLSSSTIVADLPSIYEKNDLNLHTTISQAASTSTSWLSSTSSSKSATATAAIIPLPFRQYDTAKDIPPSFYKKNKVIRGRVVKVIDGDTIRIRHTPFYPFSKGEKGCVGKKLTECTISVRFYGVDAPETAKFGNPGQPYAKEATEYTANNVKDKVVSVKLLRKDQYSRAIGRVTTRNKFLPFLKTDLSKGLVDQGYATVYTGGGAEYDGKRDELESKVKKAQKRKKGIWTNGVDDYVDPAAYKREMKARKNINKK